MNDQHVSAMQLPRKHRFVTESNYILFRVSFCSIHDETCVNDVVKIAFSLIGLFFLSASVTNLCALTLDRYLAVVHPLRYVTFMTKKRVALLVSTAWAVASTLSASLIYYTVFTRKDQQIIAMPLLLCTIAIVLGVSIFLLFATVRIFLVVRRIARRNAALVAQLNFNHKLQHGVGLKARETASGKMIGIVVTVFLVWFLLWAVDTILYSMKIWRPYYVTEIYIIVIMLNSAVNPIAYAFYKRELTTELKRLFRCNRKQNLRNESGARGWRREMHELRPLGNQIPPIV